ncbi:MAG: hypothetical protein ACE145_05675 [Terriglobia bacterium]
MSTRPAQRRDPVPIGEYIQGPFVPLSRLAHDWEMHSAVTLTPAEDRTMVREPAAAVPETIARRLGKLRALIVPYVACLEAGDAVSFSKPEGETHSAVWLESEGIIHLVLPCRELNAHDTGFEFLASVAELLWPRLAQPEIDEYARLLDAENAAGVSGEIDEESLAAKQSLSTGRGRLTRNREKLDHYLNVSFVSTLAEYMHGLWHDVQIRLGPEHLPLPQLRRRMSLLAELFPPNEGYSVFAEELEEESESSGS